MKLQSIKGFTLIELLVVITIIGILATGATTVFTSQIQKARDSTRVTDIKSVQSGVEQIYQDTGNYPQKGTSFSGVTAYVPKFPKDPKSGQASSNTVFEYLYNVSNDANGIEYQEYEISTTFEQNGNITSKAIDTADGGNDPVRLEIGLDLDDSIGSDDKATTAAAAITATTLQCVAPAGGASAACGTDVNPMVIIGNL